MSLFEIDRAIMLFVQSLRLPVLNEIMKFITTIGNAGIVWFVLIALLLIFKKTRRVGFDMLLSLAVCWVFSNLIVKPIVARTRPYVAIPELSVLVKFPSDFSFPSGHACSSFACAYVGGRSFKKKYGVAVWALAVLIAVSRIYVGVHYLTDILVGAAIGGFGGALVYALNKRYIPQQFLREADGK